MTLAPPAAAARIARERELDAGHRWQAYHVFYGGAPIVLLSECLLPLADALVADGVATEYFTINYWLEGSHVRLRVRVPYGVPEQAVDDRVHREIEAYLAASPSLHPMTELTDNGFYDRLFAGEFTEADRPRYFDAAGRPRFMPNNSVHRRPYEREWSRYGGPTGMLIAERHFVESTAQAARLMRLGNLDVRTILLGVASQLTFLTAACLLGGDRELVHDFFVAYHRRWVAGYGQGAVYTADAGRREHAGTVRAMAERIPPLMDAAARADFDALPSWLADWGRMNARVAADIREAHRGPGLTFAYDDGVRLAESATAASWSLAHSLIHMTNNRMMVSVADEAFIAFQIAEAMGGAR
ncbi:lantibiotic dehydratase C-terminal domain-containing protein [Agromyces archimandritae]|uniref:Thiopeptide-type bacteriocin biosynthesis domain-containing protein n=1 Tax=Agromyces archimandritae TaxID=2781962 RepID=A0A975IMZ7_9MICO|nr:lantibiotic dehydratase C-terminal domain-containing protein [Agromyces archimandritae]QTX04072.1 hypothetical protein G127AT_12325 [Agromyces archimandritae]